MRNKNEQELYELVEFLNQCPLGIIKADHKGQIVMQNAMASQILMPFCLIKGCSNIDIFAILKEMKPEWLQRIKDFEDSFGEIINNERVAINFPNQKEAVYLNFNIIRINETTYQYAFNEISARVKIEEELNSLIKEKAIESGKLEMAVGVLHDIGNATTSFGTDVARLQSKCDGKEKNELLKLEGLFEKQSKSLDAALGSGKGAALKNFIAVLRKSLIHRETEFLELVKKLYFTTSHIQEILNIQRSYVKGKTKGERADFKLSSIIDDALRIQERGLLKRDVIITKKIPLDTPPIKGDKTKLVQVVINAFKNCAEAFDEVKDHREKKMYIELSTESSNKMVVLLIKDNANGFEPRISKELLEKGNSHKKTGTGFGLYNCKQIIETHQGTISITSNGVGTGAEFLIKLPYIN